MIKKLSAIAVQADTIYDSPKKKPQLVSDNTPVSGVNAPIPSEKPTQTVQLETVQLFEKLVQDFQRSTQPIKERPKYTPREDGDPFDFLRKKYGDYEELMEKGIHGGIVKRQDNALYQALHRYANEHEISVWQFLPSTNAYLLNRKEMVESVFGDSAEKVSKFIRTTMTVKER
jgi:hypothetical protein